MKIVLDTNVLVSGVFWTGPPYQILRAWRYRRLQICFNPEIFDEYRRVLIELRTEYPHIEDTETILDLLALEGECSQPVKLKQPVCRDSHDDKFIACALACDASSIVTGDKDLLCLSPYQGIEIVKPRTFIKKYLHE